MLDYFDYIAEAAEEDIEDVDIVYNETDATLAEFDSYVQEGVGLYIASAVGIAAIVGGLIALIVKLFNKSSDGTTAKAKATTKEAKKDIDKAKKAGVDKIRSKYRLKIDEGAEFRNPNLRDDLTKCITKITNFIDNTLLPVVTENKSVNKKTHAKLTLSLSELSNEFGRFKRVGDASAHNRIQQFVNAGVLEHSPEGFEMSVEELAGTNSVISIFLSQLMTATKGLDKSYKKLKSTSKSVELPKSFEEDFGKLVGDATHFAILVANAIVQYNVEISSQLKKEIEEYTNEKLDNSERVMSRTYSGARSRGYDADFDDLEEFGNHMSDPNSVTHFR